MIYEISNPSDAYTLVCDDFKVAAAAVLLLGEGHYGLKPLDHNAPGVPIFIFGGADAWLKENGLDPLGDFIDAHRLAIAACLESEMIGDASDRATFTKMLDAISSSEDRERARLAYHDERRSSLNNIGKRARAIAKRLRELEAEGSKQPAEGR